MAEMASTPPSLVVGKDTSTNNHLKASRINEVRIDSVIERLMNRLHNPSSFDPGECSELCLSLARGIDFCVSNDQTPAKAQQLPLLLKQIFQPKCDPLLLAAIMVVMISVKSANESNWFSEKDTEELHSLMNEIGKHFCSSMDFSIETSCSHPIISTVMSRFYPRMKMGQILFVLEAKPGFGAYVKDFRLAKRMRHSSSEVFRLLVARTDNTETSTCLVSPPHVNFLLNGKGVEKRVNISMEVGPQMPTVVTSMLKYGCNLLQAVGDFNGCYIIVMAVLSETPTLSNLELEDYVQPAATLVDPDSDLIEGPSRISLNCPISFKRIKTPVKGHSCKHHQCFDFDNYLDINSKKPSWRCPVCNTHVCFTDIRIDQNMAKVLSDIGENVNDVIISSDGSWKAIMESDDHSEKQQRDKISGEDVEMSEQLDPLIVSSELLDLTELDDEMDSIKNIDSVDRKVPNAQDDFWSGMYLSTFPSQTPIDVSDTREDPSPANVVPPPPPPPPPPLSVDVINREAGGASTSNNNAIVPISGPQNELTSPTSTWQLQQYQTGGDVGATSTNSNNESWRSYIPFSRNITRTPNAVQALPAQQQPSNPPGFHRQRSIGSTSWGPSSSMTNVAPVIGDMDANMFSRPQFNSSQQRSSPSLQPHLNSNYMRNSVPQSQQTTGAARFPHLPSGVQYQSVPLPPYTQAHGVQGGPRGVSSPRMGLHIQHTIGGGGQRAAQTAMPFQSQRTTSSPTEGGSRTPRSGGSTTQQPAFDDLMSGGGGDQDWRPSGKMRGSLEGSAFEKALNYYTLPTTQQPPPNRSPPSLPSMTTSQQQIQMANRAALHEVNRSTGLSSSSTPSGVLPNIRSPRMN